MHLRRADRALMGAESHLRAEAAAVSAMASGSQQIGFLDADALPGDDVISREAVAPLVIRTEKRRAIDADGNPLPTPGNHTAETGLAGWGARIRTWECRRIGRSAVGSSWIESVPSGQPIPHCTGTFDVVYM
jgi:hypothetical protein